MWNRRSQHPLTLKKSGKHGHVLGRQCQSTAIEQLLPASARYHLPGQAICLAPAMKSPAHATIIAVARPRCEAERALCRQDAASRATPPARQTDRQRWCSTPGHLDGVCEHPAELMTSFAECQPARNWMVSEVNARVITLCVAQAGRAEIDSSENPCRLQIASVHVSDQGADRGATRRRYPAPPVFPRATNGDAGNLAR